MGVTQIKIIENIEEEGGYLICINNSINGLEDCVHDWVKNIEDLKEYIIRKSWNIVWFYDRAI